MTAITYTLWPDIRGRQKIENQCTWREFVSALERIDVVSKDRAPLLKFATFGNQSLPSGALRHDKNVLEIFGIEGDYDSGEMTPETALKKLEAEKIKAVVVTTHNHTPEKPRWRVFCPLSKAHSVKDRDILVAALNGALGGVLAPESYRLSQSFFIGKEAGRVYQVLTTFGDADDGLCIDEVGWDRVSEMAIWPSSVEFHQSFELGEQKATPGSGLPHFVDRMLEQIPPHEYDVWLRVGAALHFCDPDAGFEIWDNWSASSDKYPGSDELRFKWASFRNDRENSANAATIAYLARSFGYDGPVLSNAERWTLNGLDKVDLSGFSIFNRFERELPLFASLTELVNNPDLLAPPKNVIPNIAWVGRTTGLVGPDKSGKSTLMGHAVAALSRGTLFFGNEVVRGSALVVAPDEAIGDTVRRLKELDCDTDQIRLLTMHTDRLLDLLRDEMDRHPPDLLLVDSLAEWARLVSGRAPDDGDSAGWGAVIRPLVQLSRDYNCATVVLHHPRRSDGQYRGSGEIAAALDCLLEIRLPSNGEDPNLRKFSGRARWPVEPFEVTFKGTHYEMTSSVELPIRTRIFFDLKVAGPSTRNQQIERLKIRKATYLSEIKQMIEDGLISDEFGTLEIIEDDS